MRSLEDFLFKVPLGIRSRFVNSTYRMLGMKTGNQNRFEKGRIRRAKQISIGNNNNFSNGYQLWPLDEEHNNLRIKIGNENYFNRNVMIDACGYIEIGNENQFGPDIYITDSNHTYGNDISPKDHEMQRGTVKIGNYCWIGAKVVILKDVELGDFCVVAAGAVVTKSFPKGSVIGGVPARIIKQ